MAGYRVFDHTADIGVRATGGSKAELFANAARGLTSVLCDLRRVRAREEVALEATSPAGTEDDAALLVAFLSEVLYVSSVRHLLLRDFDVSFPEPGKVAARARGETVTERHPIEREVKAVTYHQARVERTARGWRAQVILDI